MIPMANANPRVRNLCSSAVSGHFTTGEQVLLATRIRDRDPGAEEEIVHLFFRRIRTMMVVRTRDSHTADDLTQDTLMTVLVALREGRLRASDRLAAFVYGVARNVVNNHLRGGQQHPTDDAVTPDMCQAVFEDQVEIAERWSMLRRALEGLASVERRILLLTLVDGLKPGAIAEKLGLSSEVVRARKSRALKRVVAHVGRLSDRGWVPPSIPAVGVLN